MTNEFKVKFRGVRGSYTCAQRQFLKYGGNTSCVEVHVGGRLIILDAGTGMINTGNDLMHQHLLTGVTTSERTPIEATILLSHIHQDHIAGFTFFAPNHVATSKINVYGHTNYDEVLADELAKLLFAKSFPMDLGDIAAEMNIYNISEADVIILRKGAEPIVQRAAAPRDLQDDDVIITSYKSYAHPQEGVMVYKIAYRGKSLVYATDKETYFGGDKRLSTFARNCDLLIHDAQYTTEDYLDPFVPKQGFGHSTFDMALEAQNYANAKKLAFFHYSPAYDDTKLDTIAKFYSEMSDKSVFAAEGLEIKLL